MFNQSCEHRQTTNYNNSDSELTTLSNGHRAATPHTPTVGEKRKSGNQIFREELSPLLRLAPHNCCSYLCIPTYIICVPENWIFIISLNKLTESIKWPLFCQLSAKSGDLILFKEMFMGARVRLALNRLRFFAIPSILSYLAVLPTLLHYSSVISLLPHPVGSAENL